jgi:ArsR family transcriptional regulator
MLMVDLTPLITESESSCCETPLTARLSTGAAQQIADDLQILAHPIRLQILAMLSQCDGQICVCDIETSLPVKQPTVSHHLRLLREAGLIVGEKQGHYVYYAVQPEAVQTLWNRLQSGMTSIL